MTTETPYRIIGDVIIKPKISVNGKHKDRKVEISYANQKTTDLENVAIIQSRQLLTPRTPYFLVEIQRCGKMFRYFNLPRTFKSNSRSQCDHIDWYCTH